MKMRKRLTYLDLSGYETADFRHGRCSIKDMQLDAALRKLNLYRVLMATVLTVVAGGVADAQPKLEVTPAPDSVTVGEVFRVSFEVSWNGAPGDYTVLPAELEPVEWGTCTLLPSKAYVRDGLNVIVQTIEFVANQPGEVEIPAVEFQYLRPEDVQKPEKPDTPMHLNAPDAPPKLRADPFPLLVQPHTTPAWLFGVLGALLFSLLAAIGWWLAWRRKAPSSAPPAGIVDRTAVTTHVDRAKRKRLEGDFYGAYRDMAAAAGLLKSMAPELESKLTARAEEIGYRGVRPTDDEMDGDFRAIDGILSRDETIPGA